MPKLLLIDGHAILHRAYHALPPLTNKEGMQTNAVYGFMTMMLRLLSGIKPEYLVVCFDRPEPTFRQQIYTQYQGKRPEMESNLADQIPLLHELLDTMGVAHFEVAGYEADDVIGTLAAQSQKAETIIVTGDRDMLQLVNDKVKVLVPVKGLGETKLYDEAAVRAEYGVQPRQWIDVKALKGDASDNYPGVPGTNKKLAHGERSSKNFDFDKLRFRHLLLSFYGFASVTYSCASPPFQPSGSKSLFNLGNYTKVYRPCQFCLSLLPPCATDKLSLIFSIFPLHVSTAIRPPSLAIFNIFSH